MAQTGLTREEVNLRSFPKILEQRRARGETLLGLARRADALRLTIANDT